jgi:hypothetical protein
VTEEEFARFIGDNADRYIRKFREFSVDGRDNAAATWHWPAFFLGFVWMAYGKMYMWALVAFLLERGLGYFGIFQHPIAGDLLPRVVYGVTGNYLYYRHAKKTIIELKEQGASFAIENEGGVNRWLTVDGTTILLLISLFIFLPALPYYF